MNNKSTKVINHPLSKNDLQNIERIRSGRTRKHYETTVFDRIIDKWHTYPGCEENYTDYKEIDKNSSKFKILKACSEFLNNVPFVYTLVYMIEQNKKL